MVEQHQLATRPTVATCEIEPVPAVPARIVASAQVDCVAGAASHIAPEWLRETDPLAIASAVCGLMAIVPVLSQVAGLGLGIASLVRIRRARRCGIRLRGKPWAWAGIFTSGFALLVWAVILVVLIAVRMSLLRTTGALQALAPAAQP